MAINSKNLIGGGLGVNSIKEINSPDDLYISPKGKEWLKTGVVETDVASYPDATSAFDITDASYGGVSFSVNTEDTTPYGITWDGTHFWVLGVSSLSVYQYTSTGVYTGFSFSVSAEAGAPKGICFSGGDLLVIDAFGVVFRYTQAGVYTGISFTASVVGNANYVSITEGAGHLWIINNGTDAVYQYTLEGAYTGFSFSVASQTATPHGIAWDGANFWVTDESGGVVYKYTVTGAYAGVSFSTSTQDSNPKDVAYTGEDLWVISAATDTAYRYTPSGIYYVGIQTPSTGAAGLPNFTRIK